MAVAIVQVNPLNERRIPKSESGLGKPSVVNVSQLVTIDRTVLTERVRALPGDVMRAVDEGLRMVLAL